MLLSTTLSLFRTQMCNSWCLNALRHMREGSSLQQRKAHLAPATGSSVGHHSKQRGKHAPTSTLQQLPDNITRGQQPATQKGVIQHS